MRSPIRNVEWIETDESMNDLFNQEAALTTQSMSHGMEAEVMRISSDQESFVLKVWNKTSKPDIRFQFRLLKVLFERGVSVSKPVGWGIHSNGDQVLLTRFGGTPVLELNDKKLTEIASILSNIHQIRVEEIGSLQLPKHDFMDYFFPGVGEHADLLDTVSSLVRKASIQQNCIIHGDFHLGNVVEDKNRYTIIDWTNGQLGDPRYDFAWSLILLQIYTSDRHRNEFRSAYLSENPIEQEELEVFEALACLRWLLLHRNGGVPQGSNTMEKVKGLFRNNRFLKEREFKDVSRQKKAWGGDGMNVEAIFDQFPILKSDELILKKIEDHHINEVFEIYDNDTVFEYCGIIPKHNKDTVKNMIGHFERDYNKRSRVKWGIFAQAEPNRLLGIIEAFDLNQKVNMVTIGYFLAESHWGKGIASEALRILLHFLFMDVNINRIQAEVMPLNEPSKKVLLKNGFIKEGTLRQATLWAGKGIIDLEMYSMLREEYINRERN